MALKDGRGKSESLRWPLTQSQVEALDNMLTTIFRRLDTLGDRSSSSSGGTVTWADIDKTVSSLADITTRSAGALSSGTLPLARIADSELTYAKIQDISAASLLLGRGASGAGAPQEIALGSGLSMSGTTLSASGSSGGLVFLGAQTASASASLAFTGLITSTYDDYLLELVDLLPATNGVNLKLQVSTDNGSTYDTGTNYATAYHRWSKTGQSQGGAASDSFLDLGGGLTVSNDTTEQGLSGWVKIHNPLGTSGWKKFTGQTTQWYSGTPELIGAVLAAAYKSATAANALRLIASSGNLASGVGRLYGIAKA